MRSLSAFCLGNYFPLKCKNMLSAVKGTEVVARLLCDYFLTPLRWSVFPASRQTRASGRAQLGRVPKCCSHGIRKTSLSHKDGSTPEHTPKKEDKENLKLRRKHALPILPSFIINCLILNFL